MLANIMTATRYSSGAKEIMEVHRKLKGEYKNNHAHDANLMKQIMKRLATANKQCNRTAVPVPKGFANTVTEKLQKIVDAEDRNLFTKDESAMTETSESKSSAERPAHRRQALQQKANHKALYQTTRTSTLPHTQIGQGGHIHCPQGGAPAG